MLVNESRPPEVSSPAEPKIFVRTSTLLAEKKPFRDPLIDALRSVALIRVILWHAFAAVWLSWIFPAMPVMFFLAGSLLATSSTKVSWKTLFFKRSRRLLVPFWVYGILIGSVSLILLANAGAISSLFSIDALRGVLSWIVPLSDPVGPAWQDGWLTTHLWYIRGYLWLLLLAPLVLKIAKKPIVATLISVLTLATLEAGAFYNLFTLPDVLRLASGDVLCYGLFAVLGAAWAKRSGTIHSPTQNKLLFGAGILVIATGIILGEIFYPGVSLNSSYFLLTVSGAGWLLLIAASEARLRKTSAVGAVNAVCRWVTARAVTLYLWHPAAIILARTIVPGEKVVDGVLVIVFTFFFTFVAALTFGWVEDYAAKREPRIWPGKQNPTIKNLKKGLVANSIGIMIVVSLLLSSIFTSGLSASLAQMPRPSDRDALSNLAFSAEMQPEEVLQYRSEPLASFPEAELQTALETWAALHPDITSVTVAAVSGDSVWTGSLPGDFTAPESVEMLSLTKSVTAALVLQEVKAGTINLDEPMPPLPNIEYPLDATITPRQLLQHSSGLVQYTESSNYDPERIYSTAELVSLATNEPLLFVPGTEVQYSNSGFLWLGLLLEEVTAKSYESLVDERFTGPLGLEHTYVSSEIKPGWVGSASGGVISTPLEVAKWYNYLVNTDLVLDAELQKELLDLEANNVGLGIWPLCPCGTDEEGKWSAGYGQVVWNGGAYAYQSEKITFYAFMSPGGERVMDLTPQLFETLRSELPLD